LFDIRETPQFALSDFDHAAADWSMSGRHRQACEAAGEVATAADYSEQAQHIFDELKLPSNPPLYPHQ